MHDAFQQEGKRGEKLRRKITSITKAASTSIWDDQQLIAKESSNNNMSPSDRSSE
jgi:hypothetical protein